MLDIPLLKGYNKEKTFDEYAHKGAVMRKFIARILCFCVGVSSLFAFGGCTNRAYTRELIDALENNDMPKFTRMVNYGFNLDARPLPRILSDNAVNRPPLVVAVINANLKR